MTRNQTQVWLLNTGCGAPDALAAADQRLSHVDFPGVTKRFNQNTAKEQQTAHHSRL